MFSRILFVLKENNFSFHGPLRFQNALIILKQMEISVSYLLIQWGIDIALYTHYGGWKIYSLKEGTEKRRNYLKGGKSHFSPENENTHSMKIKLNSWPIKFEILINYKNIVSAISMLDILSLNLQIRLSFFSTSVWYLATIWKSLKVI